MSMKYVKMTASIQVPKELQKVCDEIGGDLHQTFSLRADPKSLPVVTDLSAVDSSLKSAEGVRYRVIRCRVSNNKMRLLDGEKEVPVVLYDNVPDEVPRIGFQIFDSNDEVADEYHVGYQMNAENHFPKVSLKHGANGTENPNVSVMEMTPEEVLNEPWEFLGHPIKLTAIPESSSFQALLHIRVVGNPHTYEPLAVFADRPYALFAMELFVDETLLGLDSSDEALPDKPKMVLGKDIPGFCELYDHPTPPETMPVYPEGVYLPVDAEMTAGSPVLSPEGSMIGMVMFPGWGRLFTQKDIDLINHAAPLMEKVIDSESDADSDEELPPTTQL